ncbi:MAG: hypothetical protein ACOVMP_03315 [Chthoniobacterales bacterium]
MSEIETKPVTVGNWIFTIVLLAIPVVNVVLLFVWAMSSSTHPSKKSYAQAVLIVGVVGIILAVALMLLATLISLPSTIPVQ